MKALGSRLVLPLAFSFVCLVYFWLGTYGTGELLGSEVRGIAYDSLSRHLLNGDSSVDPDTIGFEGVAANGKTYMYFGPFPALVRILPNIILPSLYGQWSRISCLLAAVGSLFAFALIVSASLATRPLLSTGDRSFYSALSLLGFGLGTPLLYLISCGHIYHEAMLWGLCWSLWSLWSFLEIIDHRTPRRRFLLLSLSSAAGAALLSRVTFGVPFYLLMLPLVPWIWCASPHCPAGGVLDPHRRKTTNVLDTLALAVPAALAGFFELWYELSRHEGGRAWTYTNTYVDIDRIGGTFNLSRIPSSLHNYFGFRTDYVFSRPPFVRTLIASYQNDALFHSWKESVISLSFASAWLVTGALIGAYWVVTRQSSYLHKLLAVALLTQGLLISAFYFVTQRYATEYLPFLIAAYAWGLTRLPSDSGRRASTLRWCAFCLVLLSVFATIGSTLQWTVDYNADAPIEFRESLRRFFGTDT